MTSVAVPKWSWLQASRHQQSRGRERLRYCCLGRRLELTLEPGQQFLIRLPEAVCKQAAQLHRAADAA